MFRTTRPHLIPYGMATLFVAIALVLLLPLSSLLGSQALFLLFFLAIIASAWYYGLGSGIFATAIATGLLFWLDQSSQPWSNLSADSNLAIDLFALQGLIVSLLSAGIYRVLQRTEVYWLRSRRQQKMLRRSEEHYRLLIETIKDYAIFMLDPQGHILSWNSGAEALWGYSTPEILGRTFTSLLAPETLESSSPEASLQRAIAQDRVEADHWYTRKDGSRFYANGLLTALRDPSGHLLGFSAIVHDRTQQQQVEAQLRQAQEQLEAQVAQRTAELSAANNSLKAQIAERLRTEAWLRGDAERLTEIIATQHDIATAELDLLRVMSLITERTQKLTGASSAAILLPNGNDMVYRVGSGTITPYIGLRTSMASSLAGQCFRRGEVLRCDDTETDPRADQTICRQIGARSMIAVPLRYQRKISGVLQVLAPQEHAFTHQDAHTLELMAGFVAAAVIHAAEFEARQAMVAEHTVALAALQESEERFKGAFHCSAVGMALVGLNGQFLQVNPALCNMLGYSESELLYMNFQAITHADDLENDLNYRCRMLAGELNAYQLEKRYIHKQGHVVWTLLNVSLVQKRQGEPIHFISQIQDITERKRAEEERAQLIRAQAAQAIAEAAEQRSAFLAEASAVLSSSLDYEATLSSMAKLAVPYLADLCVIHMVDAEQSLRPLTIAHINPAQEDLARQLQQRYPLSLHHLRPVVKVLETGESELIASVSSEIIETATDNVEYQRLIRAIAPQSVMVVPLVAGGHTLGVMSFASAESGRQYGALDLTLAEDLARRAALAVDNARLYREAQQANRIKDEFLATLSHELRTPLNSILGWSRLLRSRQFDAEKTERALETIERNAKVQAQLIEDILDVSRIVQGKLQLHAHPVELIPVIEAAIDAVGPAAEAKLITIETDLDRSGSLVLGDADRLQQVIWNLLSNAIKFTPKEGRVEVHLRRVNSHLEVQVCDTGQGISSDFLPHVFDRFRQADSTSTRSHGGLGLGLAIVRHLVELQGGTVWADSPGEGQGAVFTVSLPLMAVRPPIFKSQPELSSQSAIALPEAVQPLRDLCILVVDDEADARDLLVMVLEQHGAKVTAAASAQEAIAACEQSPLEVLVSDIGMPDENGYALIHKVKALEAKQGRFIPAVALTAYAREEDRERSLAAGFQAHLAKPVEPSTLVSVIANIAGRTEVLDS